MDVDVFWQQVFEGVEGSRRAGWAQVYQLREVVDLAVYLLGPLAPQDESEWERGRRRFLDAVQALGESPAAAKRRRAEERRQLRERQDAIYRDKVETVLRNMATPGETYMAGELSRPNGLNLDVVRQVLIRSQDWFNTGPNRWLFAPVEYSW